MKINKREVEHYKAIFISFIDSPSMINTEFYTSGMRRTVIGQEINPKKRTLILFFEKEDDISLFIAEIKEGCTIDYNSYVYQCYLSDTNPIVYNHVGNGNYEVQFMFSVIKMKKEVNIKLIKELTSVNVHATYDSPCIYDVNILEDMEQININGNVVKKIKKGDTIIIDGVRQVVKCNGENKFSDVILSKNIFPLLQPGINKINIPDIGKLDVKLKIYPIWI